MKTIGTLLLAFLQFGMVNAQIPTNGLVAWYPFNGNANDESGNGNNGTINGAALTTDRFGIANSAFSFNGSSNYISLPGMAVQGTSGRSISFWVKTTTTNISSMVVATGSGSNQNGATFNIRLDNQSKYAGFMGGCFTSGGYDLFPAGTVILNNNTWHNVIVTFSSGTLLFYVDGIYEKTANLPVSTNGQSNFIGKSNDVNQANKAWFNGVIDDVGFWNRVLTQSEITALFNETPCNVVPPTVQSTIICGSGFATLTASGGTDYNWYETETGGSVIGTGASFTTPYITQTDTFWVSNVNSCESARVPAVVIVNPAHIAQNDTTICAGQSLTLIVAGNSTPVPSNGLAAYYPFNGNANDESGNENNGAVNGAALTMDRFGKPNKAYSFDGVNDYINCGNGSSLQIANDITSCMWIKSSNLTEKSPISKYTNSTSHGWENVTYSDGKTAFGGRASSSYSSSNKSVVIVINNNWHFVVGQREGTTWKIFVDGELSNSATGSSGNITNSMNLTIGNASQLNDPFSGSLDDIRIYSRALSQSEITALYNEGIPSPNYTYLWSTGQSTPHITVTPSQTTTYYVTITNNGTSCVDSVRVIVNPILTLNLPGEVNAPCGSNSVVLDAGAGFPAYSWNNGATTRQITIIESGLYKVSVTGCVTGSLVDSTRVNIIVAHIDKNDTAIFAGSSLTLSITGVSIPTDGLVGYWPFNGNADDESGNGNNGTVIGATLTADRFGNPDKSFSFNGVNNYINVPNSPLFNFDASTNFTVSAWINESSSNVDLLSGIVCKGESPPSYSNISYQILIKQKNKINFELKNLAVAQTNYFGNLTLENNIWHHIIFRVERQNSRFELWYDGSFNNQFTDSSIATTGYSDTAGLKFGVEREFAYYFGGKIDDIRLYNRSLSSSEITSLYNEGTTSSNYTYLWSTGETTASISVTPGQSTTYYVTITYGNHYCTDSVKVTIRSPSISGTISYVNTQNTPISYAIINIKTPEGVTIATSQTDQNGEYRFNVIPDGNYTVTASTAKPTGSINNADALIVLRHFLGITDLTGLKLQAADVNNSGYVNSVDALLIQKKYVELIQGFAIPDWIFEEPTVNINGSSSIILNFKGICAGDVNGSYIPPD
ncbi:MAG: dockerin type I domain-containing protein [Bacteroidetes bacterium]|nr:dockerin type I domain-containing protein [Bacteroidota bacterium]